MIYGDNLLLASAHSIHFQRMDVDSLDYISNELNSSFDSEMVELIKINCNNIQMGELLPAVGKAASLTHSPDKLPFVDYDHYENYSSIRFSDDLITRSYGEKGLVIVLYEVNIANLVIMEEIFTLIDSILRQIDHWIKKNNPFHLCILYNFLPD